MANYITDSGDYNYDATLTGTKGTNYDYSTTDECVWFDGSTGNASTGYTLDDSEWLVIEVYDMTGVTASNTLGGSHLHGAKEFTVMVGSNVVATLNAWRTAYHTAKGSTYTTYEIIATHYKGSDTADTYEADETTAFSTATTTDGTFTGHGSEWVIDDDLLADSVSGLIRPVYISFNNSTISSTPPSGITFNDITGYADTTTTHSLVDIDNASSDITIKLNTAISTGYAGTYPGDDSDCVSDYELEDAWRGTLVDTSFSIYLPAGDYEVTISSSSTTAGDNTDNTTDFTMQTITKSIDSTSDSTNYCQTWSGADKIVSTGETITLDLERPTSGYYVRINSIRITQV